MTTPHAQADENRKMFLAFYDAINRRDTGRMREMVAPDIAIHEALPPTITSSGADAVIDSFEDMWTGMPDLVVHVHEVVAEDDRVVGRVSFDGTHTGPMSGIPPTGRRAHVEAFDMIRVADGRAVEHWGLTDIMAMVTQLGLAPDPEALGVVSGIYEAFGRQDVPAILAAMSPEVRWEDGVVDHGVPWMHPDTGVEAVASFFQRLAERIEIGRFELRSLMGAGSTVVAVIDIEARDRKSGQDLSEPGEVHVWTVEDGLVTAFRHHVDTHRHVLAATG